VLTWAIMAGEMTETGRPSRPPLHGTAVLQRAVHPRGLWREIQVTERTGSTNADCGERAVAGAPEGIVVAAEEQTAGRGRLGRSWVSPPRAALTFSVLLRPAGVPPVRRGWLPLLAGVAAARAVRRVSGLDTRLKWPNDLLIGPGKLAGILAEQSGDAVVVGIGVNVSATVPELPITGALPATSLLLEGSASLDRDLLLAQILGEIEHWYLRWRGTEPPGDPQASGLRAEYLGLCSTIGRAVRAELPARHTVHGIATGLGADGSLTVRTRDGEVTVGAGDVRHVR